ncbi:hypothetical protein DFH06DRAFT_286065 [Mycena polygramma]|nr:hypothetical protein DFH06DRAFT_286065 [Mycena polygramma]
MRPLDSTLLRLICTLASPPTNSKGFLAVPPLLVARNRTKVDGSLLLLSSSGSSSVPHRPRKAWLGPARELIRYAFQETRQKRDISLDVAKAIRRFSDPVCPTNVAALGAFGKPYFGLKPRLSEMLSACLQSPAGRHGLFEADVVAERETIKKLMFPYKAKLNASFAHGVLFLGEAEEPLKVDVKNAHRQLGFIRACTRMYAPEQQTLRGRPTLHSVVMRQLGGLNLLVSGSVDCINCMPPTSSRTQPNPAHSQRLGRFELLHAARHAALEGRKIPARPPCACSPAATDHRAASARRCGSSGTSARTSWGSPRRLAMSTPPAMEAATDGVPWAPEENIGWAARVLNALRDYLQEAADLEEVVSKGGRAPQAVWRVEISPVGGEVRLLVRALYKGESYRMRFVPEAVLKAFEKEAWI